MIYDIWIFEVNIDWYHVEIGFVNRATPKSIRVEFITLFAELTTKTISIRLKQFRLEGRQTKIRRKTNQFFFEGGRNYFVEAWLGFVLGEGIVLHLDEGAANIQTKTKNKSSIN
jgi:hypothetical protein